MIDYEMPTFIKDLQNKIPKNELYFGTDEEKKDNTDDDVDPAGDEDFDISGIDDDEPEEDAGDVTEEDAERIRRDVESFL